MQKQLVIDDKTIAIGDKCTITTQGSKNGYGPTNQVVSIWKFGEKDGEPVIGLYSPIYNPVWGSSLDKEVLSGHGIWISIGAFLDNMTFISKQYEICTKFNFKDRNLESMKCKILHIYTDDNVFIEIGEDIGGNSCDGLGKTGHCVIIPFNKLRAIKQ